MRKSALVLGILLFVAGPASGELSPEAKAEVRKLHEGMALYAQAVVAAIDGHSYDPLAPPPFQAYYLTSNMRWLNCANAFMLGAGCERDNRRAGAEFLGEKDPETGLRLLDNEPGRLATIFERIDGIVSTLETRFLRTVARRIADPTINEDYRSRLVIAEGLFVDTIAKLNSINRLETFSNPYIHDTGVQFGPHGNFLLATEASIGEGMKALGYGWNYLRGYTGFDISRWDRAGTRFENSPFVGSVKATMDSVLLVNRYMNLSANTPVTNADAALFEAECRPDVVVALRQYAIATEFRNSAAAKIAAAMQSWAKVVVRPHIQEGANMHRAGTLLGGMAGFWATSIDRWVNEFSQFFTGVVPGCEAPEVP